MEFKFHFHFSLSRDIEKQIWILLFVFRFRLSLKNRFELRISFFVFASLWKTDMNFVSRFHITLKNGFEFRFSFLYGLLLKNRSESRLSFLHDLKNGSLHQSSHLRSPDTPSGLTGAFTFYASESKNVQKRNSFPFFKVMRKQKTKNEIRIRFLKWCENEKQNTKFNRFFQVRRKRKTKSKIQICFQCHAKTKNVNRIWIPFSHAIEKRLALRYTHC